MYLPENDPRIVNVNTDLNPIDRFIWASSPWGVRFNDGELFAPNEYLTDYLTREAVRAIDANRNRPFFLYLAYNAPHTPLQAMREDYDALDFIEDHDLRVYAAMIRSLDRNIGRILEALRERGLADDTLVLFTSDNGAPHYVNLGARNAPYRGWKATYFEGGIRVPFYMRWPAGLPKGARVAGPAAHFDIFATAAAAAGVAVPQDRTIDGVDLLPFARGEQSGRPHERIFWRTDRYLTLREGDWKLQSSALPKIDRLYDLALDPLEKRNLANSEPAKLAAMKATLTRIDAEQATPLWPSLGAAYVPIDRTLEEAPKEGEDYIYFSN
jgi:arylsulfatase A-like enzyme